MNKKELTNSLINLILKSPKEAVEVQLLGLYFVGFKPEGVTLQFDNDGGIFDVIPHCQEDENFYRYFSGDVVILIDKD